MKPKAKDFPSLIRWIADTYHGGVIDQIAPRTGISGATADKWAKGKVQKPTVPMLAKLCTAYELDFEDVLRIAYGRRLTPIAGGSDAPAFTTLPLIGYWYVTLGVVRLCRYVAIRVGVSLSPGAQLCMTAAVA